MRINRAIGLGLVLLIFQWLATGMWVAFESTVITVFNTTESALGAAEAGLASGTFLPQAPTIVLP